MKTPGGPSVENIREGRSNDDRKVWEDTVYEAGGRMPTKENIAYNEMVFRCLQCDFEKV